MSARDELTPEQRTALAAQLGDAKPATAGLLMSFGKSVQDRRDHDHTTQREDWYCMNLAAYMGERAAPVLRRLLEVEADVARLRGELAEVPVCGDCGHLESAHAGDGETSCNASGARLAKCTCAYYIDRTPGDSSPTAEPLLVSRFDVAMEPAPEEEPGLTIGAIAEDGRPVALLFDEEARRRVARWLAPGETERATDETTGASQ